jgi:hypothetical protein
VAKRRRKRPAMLSCRLQMKLASTSSTELLKLVYDTVPEALPESSLTMFTIKLHLRRHAA